MEHLQSIPLSEARGSLQKGGQKDYKSQSIREFVVEMVTTSNVRNYTHKVSPT